MDRKREKHRESWRKDPSLRAVCPKCGKVGSGIYSKWVLNEQKKRYEPYYWFAHPWSSGHKGTARKGIKVCYIRKKRALAILASEKLRKRYRIEEVKERK